MTKHTFPAYAFREQKMYLRRQLIKPRSMKLNSFISRHQEPNANLKKFPPDTERFIEHKITKKYCIKFRKCSHSTDKSKDVSRKKEEF